MEDKGFNLKRKIKEVIFKRKILIYSIVASIVLLTVLSFFINIGYIFTILTIIGFVVFCSVLPKDEDVLLHEKNTRRREIFSELQELNKVLKEEPFNKEALNRFDELQKELDNK